MKSKYLSVLFIMLVSACSDRKITELNVTDETLNVEIKTIIYETGSKSDDKSIIYLTDGEEFIKAGVDSFLDSLTQSKDIPAAYYVYVSSINDISSQNERERFFFCNSDYLAFFEDQLIPKVESEIGRTFSPDKRGIIGVSFGGLNAAYFAARGSAIKNFALLSPITYPCDQLNASIAFSESKDLRLWISTGTNDAETYTKPLSQMFKSKGHKVVFSQTSGGHDFENWKAQLPVVAEFLLK